MKWVLSFDKSNYGLYKPSHKIVQVNIVDAVSNYKEESRKNIRSIYVYIPLIGKRQTFYFG